MSTTRTTRVVVGVDDSLAGLQALRFAVAEARRRGAVVRAVRAWQYAMPWYGVDAGQYRTEMVDGAAMRIVSAFRLAMGGVPKDVGIEALAVEGPPARALVGQAREGDLLVVGRSRRRHPWWSRIDARCARTASCPVITVAAPVLARERGAGGLGRDVVSAAEALVREAGAAPPGRPAQPA